MYGNCNFGIKSDPVLIDCQLELMMGLRQLKFIACLEVVTLTLSARFSSQSPSENALKPPVLLGLSDGLVGGLDGPFLLAFTGLEAEGTCAAALKARARCCGCFLGVRLGCTARYS